MLQLSKKVEYGLIALRHMAMKPIGNVVTTKELSKEYDLPYELLAKILQKLARAGVAEIRLAEESGFSGFVSKPFLPDELLQVVEQALNAGEIGGST